jgi:hypothetical protein
VACARPLRLCPQRSAAPSLVLRPVDTQSASRPPPGAMATFLPDVAIEGNDWQKSAGDFMCRWAGPYSFSCGWCCRYPQRYGQCRTHMDLTRCAASAGASGSRPRPSAKARLRRHWRRTKRAASWPLPAWSARRQSRSHSPSRETRSPCAGLLPPTPCGAPPAKRTNPPRIFRVRC